MLKSTTLIHRQAFNKDERKVIMKQLQIGERKVSTVKRSKTFVERQEWLFTDARSTKTYKQKSTLCYSCRKFGKTRAQ